MIWVDAREKCSYNKSMRRLLLLIGAAALFSGCVSYPVRFNGYVNPQTRQQAFAPGQSFFVLEEENAQNPLLSQEIGGKIIALLRERSYRVESRENADYFLSYSYTLTPGSVSGIRSEYHPPETGTINTFTQGGETRTSFVTFPGYTSYFPYRYTVYTSSLRIEARDAKAMRERKQTEIVWIGESNTTSQNSDLREMVNYLLVDTFDHFGQNTRRSVTDTLSPRDPRIKSLQ